MFIEYKATTDVSGDFSAQTINTNHIVRIVRRDDKTTWFIMFPGVFDIAVKGTYEEVSAQLRRELNK